MASHSNPTQFLALLQCMQSVITFGQKQELKKKGLTIIYFLNTFIWATKKSVVDYKFCSMLYLLLLYSNQKVCPKRRLIKSRVEKYKFAHFSDEFQFSILSVGM